MRAIIARAYAKINLVLNITGRRPDGYHELDGIMIPLSLFDTIRIAKSHSLSVGCDREGLSGKANSAYKTAARFFDATGIQGGADIFIQKRIPMQAGLGGGSSDAACVLLALNELYEAHLPLTKLIDIAKPIGADIPFFLFPSAKRAQGIGEKLEGIDYRLDCSYVLVKPRDGVDTALAFRRFHEAPSVPANVPSCIEAIRVNDLAGFAASAGNMLQDASVLLCPSILSAMDELKRHGANYAQMTGSGSTAYGMFSSRETAKKAAEIIAASGLFEDVFYSDYIPDVSGKVLQIY